MILKKNILLLVFFVCVVVGLVISFATGKFSFPQKSQNNLDFSHEKEKLLKLVESQDPRTSLTDLFERSKYDDNLSEYCHILTHEIGRAAYKKYNDFGKALSYKNEFCNSGYMHGVIEEYFVNQGNILSSLDSVCSDYESGSFMAWECYHGVGHGLMFYSKNDLPESIKNCEYYEDSFSRHSCVNGALMENFNTEQKEHKSIYLNKDDMFYPCQEIGERYRSDCYLYSPTYFLSMNKKEYIQAFEWCLGAEDKYIGICISGVGSQMMKENINDPKFVETTCGLYKGNYSDVCLSGAISMYINYFGSVEAAGALCENFSDRNKALCERGMKERSRFFHNGKNPS